MISWRASWIAKSRIILRDFGSVFLAPFGRLAGLPVEPNLPKVAAPTISCGGQTLLHLKTEARSEVLWLGWWNRPTRRTYKSKTNSEYPHKLEIVRTTQGRRHGHCNGRSSSDCFCPHAAFSGFFPRIIIPNKSSSVTSSTLTTPTNLPFFITAARSHSVFTA